MVTSGALRFRWMTLTYSGVAGGFAVVVQNRQDIAVDRQEKR